MPDSAVHEEMPIIILGTGRQAGVISERAMNEGAVDRLSPQQVVPAGAARAISDRAAIPAVTAIAQELQKRRIDPGMAPYGRSLTTFMVAVVR